MFKKILLLVILAMSVVGCELLSPSYWDDVNQSRRENVSFCTQLLGFAACVYRYERLEFCHAKCELDWF